MSNIAILGGSFGDEGKGHITHHFSKDYDWVIRFNGGANAGHTIYRDGVKYVHNLLPSMDFRVPQVKAYLGAGMVIDLEKLRDEVYDADDAFPGCAKRIYVDKNAFMVLSKHKEEDKAKNAHIGSTNRGIGPAYMDKIGRSGTRIADMFNRASDPHYADFMYQLIGRGVKFVDLLEVRDEMSRGNLLYEGAQGILLDINHGIYPYVSCSDCTVGGIYTSGFHFAPPKDVYGVVKCYTTKVGEGPFPSELKDKTGDDLRERGHEYGATTGRPRRVGWLDLPALEYACKVGGITKLIMTKFDILAGMEKVPVCAIYDKPVKSPHDFFDVVPQNIQLDGWKEAGLIKKIIHDMGPEDYEYLGFDNGLNSFIEYVEKSVGRKIEYISCGTDDKDIHKFH